MPAVKSAPVSLVGRPGGCPLPKTLSGGGGSSGPPGTLSRPALGCGAFPFKGFSIGLNELEISSR